MIFSQNLFVYFELECEIKKYLQNQIFSYNFLLKNILKTKK